MEAVADHTLTDRMERGRAMRSDAPRSSHADWAPAPKRKDPVKMLEAGNVGRVESLVPIRFGRMAKTPFTFYRGAASVMAADLKHTPSNGVNVQAVGDCHLLNFGIFATPERNVVFGMNDFDETLPAPWEWDVKRFAASVILAGRDAGMRPSEYRQVVVNSVGTYRNRIRELAELGPLDTWYDRLDSNRLRSDAPDKDARRRREKVEAQARSRVGDSLVPKLVTREGDRMRIVDQPPLLFHQDRDEMMDAAGEFMDQYCSSLAGDRQVLLRRYRVEDVAAKVVGVGSVGTRCLAVLLSVDGEHPLFLQIKEANKSVLEPYVGSGHIKHEGERVVVGQRLLQPASDIFLGWATGRGGNHFYVRQLRDMKLSITLFNRFQILNNYCNYCALSLARGHANTGDAGVIAGYLGNGSTFDEAIANFAIAYADQTEIDHGRLVEAIADGRVEAVDETA
jgi:uncharacterized protein (DUF2252 family)